MISLAQGQNICTLDITPSIPFTNTTSHATVTINYPDSNTATSTLPSVTSPTVTANVSTYTATLTTTTIPTTAATTTATLIRATLNAVFTVALPDAAASAAST